MNDSFKKWLENALTHYDKVIFIYQSSGELCVELQAILKKDKRKLLLLTDVDTETLNFPCSQKQLTEEQSRWLLERYLSYSFADNFIFLTDQGNFPWPSVAAFVEAGVVTKEEMLKVMLK